MRAMAVIVILEIEELPLQISGRPEEGAIQAFAPNGANQPFNEWMRERHVRNGRDGLDVEDPQIRLPLMEPIQGIMVCAEVGRRGSASRRAIEHPAQPDAIHDAAMNTDAHDVTRALVHHNQNPVCAQDGRFTSKQIETQQTVLSRDRGPCARTARPSLVLAGTERRGCD